MLKKLVVMLLLGYVWLPNISLMAQAEAVTNSFGMEFVLIKPGSMLVGKYQPTVGEYKPPVVRAGEQPQRVLPLKAYKVAAKMAQEAAKPGFTVTIKRPYYIGKFEVTQEQWQKVMGNNPAFFQGSWVKDDTGKHPVENITWQDAQTFIKKLNKLDKEHIYCLPNEFEWEYAARAGAEDDILWANARKMGIISEQITRAVGSKEPNAWGIYDMIGNVWEWVQDYYNDKIFADPVPPQSGKEHVLKGASFTGDAKNATYLTHAAGPGNGFDVGFRIVMEVR